MDIQLTIEQLEDLIGRAKKVIREENHTTETIRIVPQKRSDNIIEGDQCDFYLNINREGYIKDNPGAVLSEINDLKL